MKEMRRDWFWFRYGLLGFAATTVMMASSPDSDAAEVKRGKALHDENCTICHDSGYYTRKDRRVKSYERLQRQVALCQEDTGSEWTEAQIKDVVTYLNTTYYKFKVPAGGD